MENATIEEIEHKLSFDNELSGSGAFSNVYYDYDESKVTKICCRKANHDGWLWWALVCMIEGKNSMHLPVVHEVLVDVKSNSYIARMDTCLEFLGCSSGEIKAVYKAALNGGPNSCSVESIMDEYAEMFENEFYACGMLETNDNIIRSDQSYDHNFMHTSEGHGVFIDPWTLRKWRYADHRKRHFLNCMISMLRKMEGISIPITFINCSVTKHGASKFDFS